MFASNTSQVSSDATYIEDVFSTYLYTGNGSTQTITNGIDLAGQGGLTWVKTRSNTLGHVLVDTVRGAGKYLSSNTTNQQFTNTDTISAFTSSGFTVGNDNDTNSSGATYASWTFRKQPKFFDVQTWTGDGSTAWRYLNHNLGSTPKCIIIKRTDTTSNWVVWHNDGSTDRIAFLNTTDAADGTNGSNGYAFGISPTQFVLDTVGGSVTASNASGGTYVAYLFAHNAGGFGLTGTDNVISCGSWTSDSAGNATIDLGYEPQWVLFKATSGTGGWNLYDNMRGWSLSTDATLQANTTAAEGSFNTGNPTATGFVHTNAGAQNFTYIYIAIRRGPMKTPTSGTEVFAPAFRQTVSGQNTEFNAGFPVDLGFVRNRSSAIDWSWADRLRGGQQYIYSNSTSAEVNAGSATGWFDSNTGYHTGVSYALDTNREAWMFLRAPGFFDVVCYTGTGVARNINHNLGVPPELMIVKPRTTDPASNDWKVYSAAQGIQKELLLNSTSAVLGPYSPGSWGNTLPTASVFSLSGSGWGVNASGVTYVAYLFASCPGVSKVFNFTGNGSSQTINCGFTGGARFVLIKRTDSTGDWYVWDSARGIVSGNDPRLSLNTTSAEVTTDDSIDPDSTGFVVNQLSATNINVNGASYIGLAIA